MSEQGRLSAAVTPAGRRRGPGHPGAAATMHVLVLLAGLAVLVVAGRGQWFVIDEWVFLTDRHLGDVRGLFVPHYEHWSTLPIVLWRGLFNAVGLHTYWPYLLVTLAVHVGVAHLLWRVQRRAGVAAGVAVATSGLFVVFGAGAENMLSAIAVTFDTSVLLGLGQVLLVDHDGRRGLFDRRDLLGWVLALGGLASSGVSVTMVAVAGLAAFLRRGWRAGLGTVGPPAAVFLVWLGLIGRDGMGAVRGWEAGRIPVFVWHGLTATFDVAASVGGSAAWPREQPIESAPGVGAVALVGLVVWLLRHRGEIRGRLAATTACAVGAVIFFATTAIGRSVFQADLSRYLYVSGALLVPAVGGALSDLTAKWRLARAAAVVLVGLLAVNGTRLLMVRAAAERAIEDQHRLVLLAAARLDLPPSEMGLPVTEGLAHMLTYGELRQIRQQGRLPSSEGVTREEELGALTILHVGVSPTPQLPVGPQEGGPTVIETRGAPTATDPRDPGCLQLPPRSVPSDVVLHVPVPVTLPFYTAADTIGVFLRDEDGRDSPIGIEVQFWHYPTYLNLNLHRRDVVLTVPADVSSRLCGLAHR